MAENAAEIIEDDQDEANEAELLDYDEAEFQDAVKAAEGEEEAPEPEGAPQPAPEAKEPPDDPDPEKGENEDASPPMIPKGRFDEVAQQRDEKAQEAAYYRGLYEGLSKSTPAPANANQAENQPEPEPTPQEKIAAARQKLAEAAEKYDEGDITTAEMERIRAEQDDIIYEARAAMLAPKEEKAPQGQPDDLYLDQLTAKLETDHPYTLKIEGDQRWAFLREEAMSQLKADGVQLGNDNRSQYHLRKKIAELTDEYGPLWVGPLDGQDQPRAGNEGDGNPKPSDLAQQRAQKLDMSENQPPNTNDLGSRGDGTSTITEKDIEKMSDDEIAALPPAVQAKFLGTT